MGNSQVVFQEQFDTNLTNSFQAFPAFQRRFGYPVPGKKNAYQLKPSQQLALCRFQGPISQLTISEYRYHGASFRILV